ATDVDAVVVVVHDRVGSNQQPVPPGVDDIRPGCAGADAAGADKVALDLSPGARGVGEDALVETVGDHIARDVGVGGAAQQDALSKSPDESTGHGDPVDAGNADARRRLPVASL